MTAADEIQASILRVDERAFELTGEDVRRERGSVSWFTKSALTLHAQP
jgi:hypothetical protein